MADTNSSPLAKKAKHDGNSVGEGVVKVIDARSDTVTKPTDGMRQAMATAEVGDDVYGEDPTVSKLERTVAELLGKEKGMYVPTGTMANLISVMVHCSRRGDELLLGNRSHIAIFEQGGVAQFAGVFPRLIKNLPDGTLDIDELESTVNKDEDPHMTISRLICIENTQNLKGGQVISLEYMDRIAAICKKHEVKLHIDGARLLNAAVSLGVNPSELTKHADSVSVCLSKGVGAPVGSVLAGPAEFILAARRTRKALGGGMRQAGIIAAGALYGLQDYKARLQNDHRNAQRLAQGLRKLKHLGITIDPDHIGSNMVYIRVDREGLTGLDLLAKMECPSEVFGQQVSVLLSAPPHVRAVTHLFITQQDVDIIIEKMKRVLS